MEDDFTVELRWLPQESLRGAWEALCHDLGRIAPVLGTEVELQPEGRAHVRMRYGADDLAAIDRCVMACLAADPLYRKVLDNDQVEVFLRFRSWWRTSVPFLIDPDGSVHHYVYSAIPTEGVPPPPDVPGD